MLIIGYSPKGFPLRSKTIYERCFLACPAPNYDNSLFGAGRKRAGLRVLTAIRWMLNTNTYPLLTKHYTKFRPKINKKVLYKHINSSVLLAAEDRNCFWRQVRGEQPKGDANHYFLLKIAVRLFYRVH
jgi:hypothetical protein